MHKLIQTLTHQANQPDSLKQFVAHNLLESDDPKAYLTDLLQHGCISGIVSELIYYTDTHAFYDRYYAEIENLRQVTEDDHGQPLTIKGDLKNALAWFAFEETARQLADEAGLYY